MKKDQNFGGTWTIKKLNILTKYLNAYIIALKDFNFKKFYIDAFAGTGEIGIKTGEDIITIDGSVKRSLRTDYEFDHYFYIESDKKKCQMLNETIDAEFSTKKHKVDVINGDANTELIKILKKYNWKYYRAVAFIDPFATQFSWETLEAVARTKSIDVWYLFPIYALNRILPKDGTKDNRWKDRISNLLGTDDWFDEIYEENPQINLFDEEDKIKCNTEKLSSYIIRRLKTIFPVVSSKSKILYNSKKAPQFLFCFACSSESEKAQKLALKIANEILKYENNN